VNADLQVSGLQDPHGATLPDGSLVPVLLVDDDADKRFAVGRLLSPLGYAIVEADSGLAALRCLLVQDFAVILLDVRMPGMDGLETAALIRQRRQSELTPIMLITASRGDELTASGLYLDSAKFMFAPAEPDQFRATVSTFGNLFLKAQELAAQAREVQAAADRLRLVTDTAPVGIFHTDRQNKFVYTNPRWTEITGTSAEAAVGQDWGIVVDAEQAPDLHIAATGDAVRRAEFSCRFELRTSATDPKTILLTSTPIPDGAGGVAGWVGTLAEVVC
jgi:PAS domain S-box-containing protein